MISAVNGRKRALLTKSALEWHNKRCTAQSTLCVGNKKGKTELKAMCDFKKKKKKKKLVSRYLGHDTIHVSPAQVSRCIDASMHRYALRRYPIIIVNAVTTHIRGSYIFTMFRVTESASTRNCRTCEKTCDSITFTIIIN